MAITAVELGPDSCALARTSVRRGEVHLSAAEILDPAAFPGVDSFTLALRQTRRALGLPRRCRAVIWGLPEGANRKDAGVIPLIQPLTDAGFKIDRVVSPCNALAALARLKRPLGEGSTCWIAINCGGVAIVVVRPGTQLYAHSFVWDSNIGAVGSQARLLQRYSLVSYLSPEVKRAMAEARKQGAPVEAIVTCGNLPDLRSLTMPLIEELDVEVETLDSLDGLVVTPAVAEKLREAASAIRLACAATVARGSRPWDGSKAPVPATTGLYLRVAALAAAAAGIGYLSYAAWRPGVPENRTGQAQQARATSGKTEPRPATAESGRSRGDARAAANQGQAAAIATPGSAVKRAEAIPPATVASRSAMGGSAVAHGSSAVAAPAPKVAAPTAMSRDLPRVPSATAAPAKPAASPAAPAVGSPPPNAPGGTSKPVASTPAAPAVGSRPPNAPGAASKAAASALGPPVVVSRPPSATSPAPNANVSTAKPLAPSPPPTVAPPSSTATVSAARASTHGTPAASPPSAGARASRPASAGPSTVKVSPPVSLSPAGRPAPPDVASGRLLPRVGSPAEPALNNPRPDARTRSAVAPVALPRPRAVRQAATGGRALNPPPVAADTPEAVVVSTRPPTAYIPTQRPMPVLLKDGLPRVTAILVSRDRRYATVEGGQIVGVGDLLGRRTVIGMDERSVLFEEPSGVRIRVGLGGRVLGVERGRR